MPFRARRPIGGFKVMYEYANRLADLGYSIHITYPIETKYIPYRFPYWIRLALSYIEGFRTCEWFPFRKGITRSYVESVKEEYIRPADVIIATWWSTAYDVGLLSYEKGKKINLIQGYENWEGHEDLLHASYDMVGMTNVVVASYLKNIVQQYTEKPVLVIPNAIDTTEYKITCPIEKRNPYKVCMLYSIQEIKGSSYGIEALKLVKNTYPDLEVELFGICPKPEGLPDWITFYRNPSDLCDLYNRNSIFLSNSFTEGMALTPMEAMFCGCASVLTDIKGHSEYAIDNETVLLYEAGNASQLSDKIIDLLKDNEKRMRIADAGNRFVQQFSWDNAVSKMDKLIKDLIGR